MSSPVRPLFFAALLSFCIAGIAAVIVTMLAWEQLNPAPSMTGRDYAREAAAAAGPRAKLPGGNAALVQPPPPRLSQARESANEETALVEVPRRVRVILDPGHGVGRAGELARNGRSEPGMIAPSGTPEYHMNWVVAEQVKAQIEALSPGTRAVITKSSATENVANLVRARHLGDFDAEILLSIHFDDFSWRGKADRRTHAIVLPENFRERIGGKVFHTHNHNQAEEIALAEKLIEAVVAVLEVPGGPPPKNGGVKSTGSGANKGVLFETTPEWMNNTGPSGELWEERLYHSDPFTTERGRAVLLEIDNMRNRDVDAWFNDPETKLPRPERYLPISEAIARVIVEELDHPVHLEPSLPLTASTRDARPE